MRQNVSITAIVVSTFFATIAHAAALRTVALTGRAAPGTTAGVTYGSFDHHFFGSAIPIFRGPVLNDAGQTAFRADLAGSGVGTANDLGVWSEGSGSLALVARTGSAAPGGGTFNRRSEFEFFTPVLNSAGQTAFFGSLTNGKLGVWSEGSGSLAAVAVDGTPAPGTETGVSFWLAGFIPNPNFAINLNWGPLLNNAGQTSFVAGLQGGEANDNNNTGIWSGGAGSLVLLARRGNPVVGTPPGAVYEPTHINFALNDAGQSAFFSFLKGSGVDASNDTGFWSQGPGSLALEARAGEPAPGTPGGVLFGQVFSPITMNSAGKVAFEFNLTGSSVDSTNDQGLWSNVSGSLELVARRGSQAAGTPSGVNYDLFSGNLYPLLNDAGQIAFLAGLAGAGVDGSNNEGIWLNDSGNTTLVARRGDSAPGASSGATFSDLHNPALNTAGQIAFRADLTGMGIDGTNDRGIWASDSTGTLQLVARRGDTIEVAPGDLRTLSDLDFASASNGSDGRAKGFNNVGQLAFWASFTDGSQGVFVSNAVAHLSGDYSGDGTVGPEDYTLWKANFGSTTFPHADGNRNGTVDAADYTIWRDHLGESLSAGVGSGAALPSAASLPPAVPEPTSAWMLIIGAVIGSWKTRRVASAVPSTR